MRPSFVDEVTILVRSGDGGAGAVAFRREKFVARGGPNGGDGGRGGHVIVRADPQMATLLDYRFRPRHLAAHGGGGGSSQCTGANGQDVHLRVPIGTQVFDAATHALLADLNVADATVKVAHGGRGGRGNEFFKSSIRQAPDHAQPGEPGQELTLRLELKLLADVGVVGFPNVGKSSLVARLSASRPKIANYPFTTLVPNLGVVAFGDCQHFVIADVPGLVIGAHQGQGLGTRFLRHVERVRVLCHMVSAETCLPGRDPVADYRAIEAEIHAHNPALSNVPRVLVLNQSDRPEVMAHRQAVESLAKDVGVAFYCISAATGHGCGDLVNQLGHMITDARTQDIAQSAANSVADAPFDWQAADINLQSLFG